MLSHVTVIFNVNIHTYGHFHTVYLLILRVKISNHINILLTLKSLINEVEI